MYINTRLYISICMLCVYIFIYQIYIYICIYIKVFIKTLTWFTLDCYSHNDSSYYYPHIFQTWDKNMCLPLINNHNFQIIFLLSLTITFIFCICMFKTGYQHFLYYLWIYYWKQLYTIIWLYLLSLCLMTFCSRGLSIKYVNLNNPNFWISFSTCTYFNKRMILPKQ